MKQSINAGGYAYVFDEDGNLWISSMGYNGLVKYDRRTREIEYVKQFDNYSIIKRNIHGNAKRIENRLFFFPLVSNYVHIYDLKNETETSIEIPKETGVTSFSRSVYEYKNFFLLFPTYLNGTIWKINSSTGEVSKHEQLTEFVNHYTIEERKYSAITFENNQMIISLPIRREILILDLIDFKKKTIPLNIKYKIQHMCVRNNNLLVTVSDVFNIYMINLETGESREYSTLEYASSEKERIDPYSDILSIDKFLIASNYYAPNICFIDEEEKFLNFNKMFLNSCKIGENGGYGALYCGMIVKENKVFFVPGRSTNLIEFDCQTKDCKCIKFMITKFRSTKVERLFVNQLMHYQEEGLFTLKDLIAFCISN